MFNRRNRVHSWSNGLDLTDHATPGAWNPRQAWCRLSAAVGALSLLALLLPGPGTVLGVLTGARSDLGRGSPVAAGEAALLSATALLVWALLGWAAVVAAVAALGRVPGAVGRRAHLVLDLAAPRAARRLVVGLVGASLITGLGGTGIAAAATGSAPADPGARPVAAPALPSRTVVEGSTVRFGALDGATGGSGPASGLPSLDWPAAHRSTPDPVDIDWPETDSSGFTANGPSAGVVVHRGDTLWSIAAAHLPDGATAVEIDQAWHRWYAANQAVIGSNPNLILPGQILLPPHIETGR